MSIVAIITARGGSKRIPRKNIKEFMGKPMLAYAIEAALNSDVFNEVMVSTDDKEIAEIALKYGASVPFMRSAETASDFATTSDVLKEVLDGYKNNGRKFDEFCCIYPCVPFLTGNILESAYKKFKQTNAKSLMPVVKFSFPIQRAVHLNKEGFLEFREPEHTFSRTQDLEPMYHDVGMFYFMKTNDFLDCSSLITNETIMFEMEESIIQDSDTLEDWKMAEIKYNFLKGNTNEIL